MISMTVLLLGAAALLTRRQLQYWKNDETLFGHCLAVTTDNFSAHNIPSDKVIVVVRPPGPWAAYHRFENTVFDEMMASLASDSNAFIVSLPRVSAFMPMRFSWLQSDQRF